MIRSVDEAVKEVKRLGLPDVFVSIWERDIPDAIYDVCSPPELYFDLLKDSALDSSLAASFVPLWEENLESAVGFDRATGMYIRHYYRSCEENVILGRSYQEFITAFLVELMDSGLSDEIDDIAALFEYPYAGELKMVAEGSSDHEWADVYAQFLKRFSK